MTHRTAPDSIHLAQVRADAPEQLAELAVLGEQTFIEAYGDKIDPTVLVPYAREVFVPELLASVGRPESVTLWVRDSTAVAYASVRLPPAPTPGDSVHLDRIYVRAAHHRRGLGRLLVQEAITIGQRASMARIGLGVWEENTSAIAFYETMGFVVRGEETFQLGPLRQRDLLMCRSL